MNRRALFTGIGAIVASGVQLLRTDRLIVDDPGFDPSRMEEARRRFRERALVSERLNGLPMVMRT